MSSRSASDDGAPAGTVEDGTAAGWFDEPTPSAPDEPPESEASAPMGESDSQVATDPSQSVEIHHPDVEDVEESADVEESVDDADEGDVVEGDAVEGDAVEGDAVEDDAVEDDAVEDDAVEDDADADEAVEGDADEDDADDDAVEDDAVAPDDRLGRVDPGKGADDTDTDDSEWPRWVDPPWAAGIEHHVGKPSDEELVEVQSATADGPPEQPALIREDVEVPMVPAARAEVAAPVPPTTNHDQRSRRNALVLSGLVLVLLLTAVAAAQLLRGDGEPEAEAPAPSSPVRTEAPSTSGPPAEAAAEGTHTQITMLSTGDLMVRQHIQSSAPLTGIALAMPTDPFLADSARVTDMRIAADGATVDAPTSIGSTAQDVPLASVHAVDLTYRLSGVVVRSSSRPDRALVRVTGLDATYEPRGGPRRISIEGANMLSLVCTDSAARKPPTTCGQRIEGGLWEVASPTLDSVRVMALVELATTSS